MAAARSASISSPSIRAEGLVRRSTSPRPYCSRRPGCTAVSQVAGELGVPISSEGIGLRVRLCRVQSLVALLSHWRLRRTCAERCPLDDVPMPTGQSRKRASQLADTRCADPPPLAAARDALCQSSGSVRSRATPSPNAAASPSPRCNGTLTPAAAGMKSATPCIVQRHDRKPPGHASKTCVPKASRRSRRA